MEYAVIRHSRASTCCIWMVLTRVQRPWRMMSTVDLMEGSLDVKGAATEASPSLICGVSPGIRCIGRKQGEGNKQCPALKRSHPMHVTGRQGAAQEQRPSMSG